VKRLNSILEGQRLRPGDDAQTDPTVDSHRSCCLSPARSRSEPPSITRSTASGVLRLSS
jgi:hypothetical protein